MTSSRDRPRRRARLPRPLAEFLDTEAAGGVALLVAAAVALVWANSPWQDGYTTLWSTHLDVFGLDLSLQQWINDGLMTIFFFVVGLEIKRELVAGELREPRRAALPAVAAAGGMLAPALIYLAFNAGRPGSSGWGIPVATDIAVAVGVVSLLGARVDPALKLFLLALAIVDDIGAIVIIVVFYAGGIEWRAGLVAVALVGVVIACRAAGVRAIAVYVVLGAALWLAVHESGVHATLTGVVLGLLAPARSDGRSHAVVERLEHRLHPWSSFVIVPLFALANAGVVITAGALGDAWSSSITHGVVVGLVLGKLVGVVAFTWLAVRLRIGALPAGVRWGQLVGIGAVAGIGFTVSLFVTGLAFDDPALQDEAKIGILIASTAAGILGALLLRLASGRAERSTHDNVAP